MARWSQTDLDAYIAKLRAPGTVASETSSKRGVKRPKYGNVKKTDAVGIVHDSAKELRRWEELKLRERAGEIRSLRRQVPYALVVRDVLIATYVADFDYREGEALVVEDVKSEVTRRLPVYRLKAKLMKACLGIDVREV